MESLRYLYRIGRGPSSSHTMGPESACLYFKDIYQNHILSVDVTLYGSLAFTGKGHLTDTVIKETLKPYPSKYYF